MNWILLIALLVLILYCNTTKLIKIKAMIYEDELIILENHISILEAKEAETRRIQGKELKMYSITINKKDRKKLKEIMFDNPSKYNVRKR